jgi:hypothetical protein
MGNRGHKRTRDPCNGETAPKESSHLIINLPCAELWEFTKQANRLEESRKWQ